LIGFANWRLRFVGDSKLEEVLLKEIYKRTIDILEDAINELDQAVPRPKLTSRGWRHDEDLKDKVLASFLKASRIISLLNASLVLLEAGYAQEVYMLGRAIDETVEEIMFLAIEDPKYLDKQTQMLEEFYMEELEDHADPTSRASRNRVPKKKVRAALYKEHHNINIVASAIQQLFSGFVHGAYVHLMELFTTAPPRFPTRGLLGNPYQKVCEENLANHIYRSIGACRVVAKQLGKETLKLRLAALMTDLGKVTDVVAT
jgi:hypothetical protein